MAALRHLVERVFHVVAQIVEAELIVRAIGNVAGISRLALTIIEAVHNGAGRHAEEAIELAHPFGVAAGEVIVDGNDVHALSGERVEIDGQRCHQRLALTGAHFGDGAPVQHHAADQLHIEVTHAERADRTFANDREGLFEKVVQRFALVEALTEGCSLGFQLLIGERLHLRLQSIDPLDAFAHRLDLSVVGGTEHFAGKGEHGNKHQSALLT